MSHYEIEAELLTPCCISERPAMGNEVETLDYIPGSALRGMLADAYLRSGAAPDPTFRRIFCSDVIRFPNLYPDGLRPIPLSAYTCKHYGGFKSEYWRDKPCHGVWDLLFEDNVEFTPTGRDRRDLTSECDGAPLKRNTARWYQVHNDTCRSGAGAAQLLATRTAISSTSGSAVDGSLHSQHELAPGSRFSGDLRASDASAATDSGKGLTHVLFEQLGGTATDGVGWFTSFTGRRRAGRLRIRILPRDATPKNDFYDRWPKPDDANYLCLAMSFHSDVILIDRLLRPIIALDAGGITLREEMSFPKNVDIKIEKAFVSTRRVAGWNAVAGIFKADDVALVAGSSFLLTVPVTKQADVETWTKMVIEQGVGLRRAEGFGDVRFDEPLHHKAARLKGGPL